MDVGKSEVSIFGNNKSMYRRKKMISDVISQMSKEFITEGGQSKKIDKNATEEITEISETTGGNEKSPLSKKTQETGSNHNYAAVNRDGDTLEISNDSTNNKIAISEKKESQIPDISLKNYSKSKLKQLLQSGKISRQQYNRIIKKQKS